MLGKGGFEISLKKIERKEKDVLQEHLILSPPFHIKVIVYRTSFISTSFAFNAVIFRDYLRSGEKVLSRFSFSPLQRDKKRKTLPNGV